MRDTGAVSTLLNFHGPQSSRPMPRWYWYSVKEDRWRRFDKAPSMDRDLTFYKLWKAGKLKPGDNDELGITIESWDPATRSGTFHWKNKTNSLMFIRLDQNLSVENQVDNFIFDSKQEILSQYIQKYPHVQEAFREMMRKETKYASTHVFFYHSYGATALINDIGACIMRAAFPEMAKAREDYILPRTDRSAFNNRSVYNICKHFEDWYGTDTSNYFKAIGMSTVLNCLKPDTEATVVDYFKGNYQVGTNLNDPLNELLSRFQLLDLKGTLLQMALQAEIDVGPYFHNTKCFEDDNGTWKPMHAMSHQIIFAFYDFLDNDDREGPVTKTIDSKRVTLSREAKGGQAKGKIVSSTHTKKIIVNTLNTGNYLQLAVPHKKDGEDFVTKLAYKNVLIPSFGYPDPLSENALNKIKNRRLTIDGQARLIPRPDLMWSEGVEQKLYHFSRYASKVRPDYLTVMQAIISKELEKPDLLQRAQRLLRPIPIVVHSHNTMWEAQLSAKSMKAKPSNIDALVTVHTKENYSFACLQECTTTFVTKLEKSLNTDRYTLLKGKHKPTATVWSVMIYDSNRFFLKSPPLYSCFQHENGTSLDGRPAMVAIFEDSYLLNRRLAVASIHAPHKEKEPYSLEKNVKHFIKKALENAFGKGRATHDKLSHIIIAGDFNRKDWNKTRHVWNLPPSHPPPPMPKLISAQKNTLKSTHMMGAIDNVLFSSRDFMHTLELSKFEVRENHGSDHHMIKAVFDA